MRTVLLLLALLVGCDPWQTTCSDLPDVVHGPAGLEIVAEDEHPGWGQTRCLSCHSVERMHVANCTGITEVDVAAIRAIVDAEGDAACSACHGENGVNP